MITTSEKLAARYQATVALRAGKLTVQPCEKCGQTERIHMHHEDYTKPLDVRWLCCHCHGMYHDAKRRASNILRPEFFAEWLADPYVKAPSVCLMPPKAPKADLAPLIGRIALLTPKSFPTIKFQVLIKDARYRFGRTDVLVTPVGGSHEEWMNIKRLELLAA